MAIESRFRKYVKQWLRDEGYSIDNLAANWEVSRGKCIKIMDNPYRQITPYQLDQLALMLDQVEKSDIMRLVIEDRKYNKPGMAIQWFM